MNKQVAHKYLKDGFSLDMGWILFYLGKNGKIYGSTRSNGFDDFEYNSFDDFYYSWSDKIEFAKIEDKLTPKPQAINIAA